MIHLGIVEDESFMLQSIRETFSRTPDVQVTVASQTLEEFFDQLKANTPLNTLLLDINLPGMSGLQGIRRLKDLRPELDIIMLTSFDDSASIFEALCAGAVSYISKKKVNPSILRDAVFTVHRGGSYMSPGIARRVIEHFAPARQQNDSSLTPRQHDIVNLLTKGYTYKRIADDLNISVETVRDHIKKIYKTLQVHTRAEVIRKKMDGEI